MQFFFCNSVLMIPTITSLRVKKIQLLSTIWKKYIIDYTDCCAKTLKLQSFKKQQHTWLDYHQSQQNLEIVGWAAFGTKIWYTTSRLPTLLCSPRMVIWGCQLWKPPDSQRVPPSSLPTEPRGLFPLPFSRSPNPLLMVSNGGPEEDSSSGVWKSLLEWECRAWRSAQPSAPQTAPGPSCPICTKTLKVTRATQTLSFFLSLAYTHTIIACLNKQTNKHSTC